MLPRCTLVAATNLSSVSSLRSLEASLELVLPYRACNLATIVGRSSSHSFAFYSPSKEKSLATRTSSRKRLWHHKFCHKFQYLVKGYAKWKRKMALKCLINSCKLHTNPTTLCMYVDISFSHNLCPQFHHLKWRKVREEIERNVRWSLLKHFGDLAWKPKRREYLREINLWGFHANPSLPFCARTTFETDRTSMSGNS